MIITRDEHVDLIKAMFRDLGQKFLMDWLVSKVPFLAWGFINPIVAMFVGALLSKLLEAVFLQAFFLMIDLRVSLQGRKFLEAAKKYQDVKDKTPEEKARAEAEIIAAARVLIDFRS